MEKLFLTVACGDYDRTKPLQDGSVESGDTALLIAFGAGLSYAAQVVTVP